MPLLIIEKGPDRGQTIRCSGDSPIIFGRSSKAHFKLNDTLVSREHFKIYCQENAYYVEDLGSLNGTMVNGELISQTCSLSDGSQISIGETCFSWCEKDENIQDPLLQKNLAGYQIIKRLGRGGMGTVYLARQLSLQRDVAMKVLDARLAQQNKDFIDRFIEEARASAILNHPNIIQVYDVGQKEGFFYFSMEYAAKGSIQRLIEGQKKLPVEEAIVYMLHTAQGLEYAERKKIVHRDIKPDNLMLSEENVVKIGDLGIAKRIGHKDKKDDGLFYGTAHFVAPEQAKGGKIDHRADMYAFAASFYRILSGQTPFQGKNLQQIVMKLMTEDPEPLSSLVPTLPREVCDIIGKMMQKEPDQRYTSHVEVVEEINRIQKKIQRMGKEPTTKSRKVKKDAIQLNRDMCKTTTFRRERLKKRNPFTMYYVCAGILLVVIVFFLVAAMHIGHTPKTSEIKHHKGSSGITAQKKTADSKRTNDNRNSQEPDTPTNASKDTLEQKYLELKKSQFTSSNVTYFIVEFQNIVNSSLPDSDLSKKAMEDLRLLLQDHLFNPTRELVEKKEYCQALQLIEKFGIIITLQSLRDRITDCKRNLEQSLREEVFQKELNFQEYANQKQYPKLMAELEWIREVSKFCMPDTVYEFNQVINKWTDVIGDYKHVEQKGIEKYDKLVASTINSLDYQNGAKKLTSMLANLTKAKQIYPEEWTKTLSEFKKLAELFDKMDAAVQSGKLEMLSDSLQHDFVQQIYGDRNIASVVPVHIKNGKFEYRVVLKNGGNILDALTLGTMDYLWLYQHVMLKLEKPELWFAIAIYCYRYKLYYHSWECCQNARQANVADPYLNEIQEKLNQIEKTAEQEYARLLERYRELNNSYGQLVAQSQEQEIDKEKLEEHKNQCKQQIEQFSQTLEKYREKYQYTSFFLKTANKNKK